MIFCQKRQADRFVQRLFRFKPWQKIIAHDSWCFLLWHYVICIYRAIGCCLLPAGLLCVWDGHPLFEKRGFQARLRFEAFLLCYKKERRPHACMVALAAPSRKRTKKYDVLVRLADSYD